MGAVFTQKDLDSLIKQLDPSGDGTCSFKEFVVGLRNLDTSKLGGLADVCKCVPPDPLTDPFSFFDTRGVTQREHDGVHRVV
jgi:hypothetical protein